MIVKLPKHALPALLVFAAVEIIFVLFVDKPLAMTMRSLDQSHTEIVNFFRVITHAGSGGWYAWPSGLGVLICLGLYYSPYFNGAARAKILGTAKALTFFFASTSIAGIFADFLKPLFGRARPKLLFADDLSGFHPMTFGSDWASMPSGHTTTVFAVAAALMVFFPRARYLLLIFAVTVGLSRVMVNAHYLSDVLFGAVIGWYVAQATRLWFEQKGMLGVGKMAPNP